MNAFTPIAVDQTALRALDELEGRLDRIVRLADVASRLVEVTLGRDCPACELDVLLSFIRETAEAAECARERGMASFGKP
jgi:hypothetical protein